MYIYVYLCVCLCVYVYVCMCGSSISLKSNATFSPRVQCLSLYCNLSKESIEEIDHFRTLPVVNCEKIVKKL